MKKQIKFVPSERVKSVRNGNRYVISDIHGCYKTLQSLLKKVNLASNDQLFFLGDFIDRGPDSAKTLDMILELMSGFPEIYALRGNHEQMLMEVMQHNPEEVIHYARYYKVSNLLENALVKEKYMRFFKSLPYFYELDDCYLVHAGFNFQAANPFTDYTSMLYIRGFKPDAKRLNNKIVIHGHDPTPIDLIKKNIKNRGLKIPLDNGCVFNNPDIGLGTLLCLNLDSFELIKQKNIDF